MTRSVLSRATDAVANRLDRRSFIARSAVVGSALVTAPADLLLRPTSAYAAVCSCQGQSCACGSLCCDGYTEFCCAIYGINACPTGSLIGGWWKADGSSYCGGAARYYMDCHKPCGTCSCGGSGLCSGSCNGTACGCGLGRCDYRKAGCTSFRYGNCNNGTACIGPIQCRLVTCTAPWLVEPTCSSTDVRTDNNTAFHNRPCLQTAPPIYPVTGNWGGDGKTGIGFYDNLTGLWTVRPDLSSSAVTTFRYGQQPGDRPVVGDWDGDGKDGDGIFRVGGEWNLAQGLGSGTFQTFKYGQQAGDLPVVGDWDGDGRDGVAIFRRGGDWYLAQQAGSGAYTIITFGQQVGDIPVVGDWTGSGRDSIGVYRPSEGRWHLRDTTDPLSAVTRIDFGPKWLIG